MMEKKFRFWRFLGALFLPFLIFAIIYAVAMMIHTKLFYSLCTSPLYDEPNNTFLCFLSIILFTFQLLISVLIIKRSKNLFVLVGFIISISITATIFHYPVVGKVTYKKRIMNLSNWKDPYKQDNMVGYFIRHNIYVGKTYEEVVSDLGEPLKTKIPGKYVYEITNGMWMYELFFENGKCVRQELYCNGFDNNVRADYYKENF